MPTLSDGPHQRGTPAPRRGLWVVVLLALGLVVWRLRDRYGRALTEPHAVPRVVTPRGDLAADEQATIALFRTASPAVVYITTPALKRDIFSLNLFEIPQGTGSGVVWDDRGHILTNFHVIQEAGGAKVTLADHSTWDARLVGVAPDQDLAVLVINAPPGRLQPIALGTSTDLQVGQKVFAIGNPFGLDQTLTTGIISALGREIPAVTGRTIAGVIQTDAAIDPGNSGGPILDSAGRLIGINTAIYGPSGANIGIGFAVPVDTVNRVVLQLMRHGRVIRPGLGVRIADAATAHRLGLTGVLLLDVRPGSGAAAAGLRDTRRDDQGRRRLGNRIVGVEADPVTSVDDLMHAMETYKAGDTVTVPMRREKARLAVPVTLQALP